MIRHREPVQGADTANDDRRQWSAEDTMILAMQKQQCLVPGPRARGMAYVWTAVGLVTIPPLVDLAVSGPSRVFGYLAADAFYYLTVGRNFSEHGVFAFDGVNPTNGYHPLWQVVIGMLFVVSKATNVAEPQVLLATTLLGLLLLGAGLVCLGVASSRGGHAPGPGWLTLPVGTYGALVAPIWLLRPDRTQLVFEGPVPLHGTLWTWINGMESSLAILMLGVVAVQFVGNPRSESQAATFGTTLGLLTLSRLDLGIVAVCLLVARLAPRTRGRVCLAAVVPFLLLVAGYLGLNRLLVGATFPTSGALKSTFPHATDLNARALSALLTDAPVDWFVPAFKMAQMVLPLYGAIAYSVLARRPSGNCTQWNKFLGGLSVGVGALALYGFLFVPYVHQGHWYYPVSVLFLGLLGIQLVDSACHRYASTARRAAAVAVLLAVATIASFVTLHRRVGYHDNFAKFYYEEGPRIRRAYAHLAPRLLEFDDGIVAFTTGFPALSGSGLALDPAALVARANGQLMATALARGHTRLTSFVYGQHLVDSSLGANRRTALLRYAEEFLGTEASVHSYECEYISTEHRFAILRVAEPTRPGPLTEADEAPD